jgi:hypothetical protein
MPRAARVARAVAVSVPWSVSGEKAGAMPPV